MKNYLVTGGAGFIGSHLVDRLLARSAASVTVVDNFNDLYETSLKRDDISGHIGRADFTLVEDDICDSGAMEALLTRCLIA